MTWAKAAHGKNSWTIQYKYVVFWSLHYLASPSKAKFLNYCCHEKNDQENEQGSVFASASTTTKIYGLSPQLIFFTVIIKIHVWGSAF